MMEGMGRYSNVSRYIDAAIEVELAIDQRRASLVAGDELARMGEVAFVEPGAEHAQDCVDQLVRCAVVSHLRPERASELPANLDLADLVGFEGAAAMRKYADARVALVVTREAKAVGTRGVTEPAYYTGVWDHKARYCRNAMVTDRGTLWFCESREGTTDRPGTSGAWKLMVKNYPPERERKRDGRHAGATP